ncbi:MAG TPA: DUF6786 family protein [Puia sp.]
MIVSSSCHEGGQKQVAKTGPVSYQPGTFGYDLDFLRQHDSVVVLSSREGKAQIIVSPKYQGKVFTSTAAGDPGPSFGWVNYKAFNGPVNAHMNGYGGENRLWLGPEGGRYSLFFAPGSRMVFDNWRTPAAFDTEAWQVSGKDDRSVTLSKDMKLLNYHGMEMSLHVDRNITILGESDISGLLGVSGVIQAVGYRTVNRLTNTGDKEWTKKSGAPCIWILDMFKPTDSTVIVVPFKNPEGKPLHAIATTDYFGEIGGDRLKHGDSILYFKADGKKRGKLGVYPGNAEGVAGSYDAKKGVLTLIFFDITPSADYLNQQWTTDKPPFSGDALNAYNDGPLADGTQMGPFYELESVAPAAFLKPGATQVHNHIVVHCMGDREVLDRIAQKVLRSSLESIEKAF